MAVARGYQVRPFDVNRRMVAASAAISRETNTIHAICEVDISRPRRLMREHHERTGEQLSLTAYVVACLARVVAQDRLFNARRRGRKLYLLEDVTVSTLIEREIDGRPVPEPLAVQAADKKTFRQIHDELRAVGRRTDQPLGSLGGMSWVVRLIPSVLFKLFVRLASRSIGMARRYGVVGVTAVGMFGPSPLWLLPLSSATVAVAVGSIVERPVLVDGRLEAREHLCLTLSFNHDLIDGAPAARFARQLADLLTSGELLREAAA